VYPFNRRADVARRTFNERSATLADAILDRIVHDGHRIQLRGESLRKKKVQEQG
jgi:DNA replication protein DnaC